MKNSEIFKKNTLKKQKMPPRGPGEIPDFKRGG
jgi:hypothetical protein